MPPAALLRWQDADGLPVGPGAYAIVVAVTRPFTPPIRTLAGRRLPAGRYLYGGAANGPGGIRARLRRHVRREKPVHWHVDWLTNTFGAAAAVALPGGDECGVLAGMRRFPGVATPIPGFGSSDCARCPAHLVSLPGNLDIASALGALATASGASGAVLWQPPASFSAWPLAA